MMIMYLFTIETLVVLLIIHELIISQFDQKNNTHNYFLKSSHKMLSKISYSMFLIFLS